MDVKSTWTLKSSNGSCSMVTWTIFKNHLLEVDLTHNREAMALPTFITVELLCFIMCEDLYEVTFIEIAFDFGLGHIWLHTTLEDLWPHYMSLEVYWDGLWTLSFGLSQFHGHGSWLVCEVALRGCICNIRSQCPGKKSPKDGAKGPRFQECNRSRDSQHVKIYGSSNFSYCIQRKPASNYVEW
jgi:hypothetical protein